MNAWLLWLAVSIILGRLHLVTSQDGELMFRQESSRFRCISLQGWVWSMVHGIHVELV